MRTPYDKFYRSVVWRRVREHFLAEHPVCSNPGCHRPSSRVDHIKSRRDHPGLALDETNLQALCHGCHSAKTAKYDSGFGNPKREPVERDADGWPVWRPTYGSTKR